MRLSDDNLRGRTIIAADGQVVGEVAALNLDCELWWVESLQAKLNKAIADQIGAERGIFHAGMLEIPVRMVQSVGDTVVLSISIDGLCKFMSADALATTKDATHMHDKLTHSVSI